MSNDQTSDDCPVCLGTGVPPVMQDRKFGDKLDAVLCPACNGSGKKPPSPQKPFRIGSKMREARFKRRGV